MLLYVVEYEIVLGGVARMEQMSLEEVIKHFRTGALLLRFAIDSGQFPEPLLHTFACDCAQRALMWERASGLESHTDCWKATGTKRLWIEDRKSRDELIEVHQGARKVAEDSDSSAAWAATWASSEVPMLAARCAAHYGSAAAKPAERETPTSYAWNVEKMWQRERFLWLIDVWQECKSEAPSLLREGRVPVAEHTDILLDAGIPQ